MDTATVLTLVIAVGGLLAVLVGWLTWRESHRATVESHDMAKIKSIVDTALAESLDPLKIEQGENKTRVAVLETQVNLLWGNLQKDMARILHSPDPRRSHVDHLMDKLIDDVPLSGGEETELRGILDKIMHYEPGISPDLGFPVHPGEQVVAAFLLRSLDYVPIKGSKR